MLLMKWLRLKKSLQAEKIKQKNVMTKIKEYMNKDDYEKYEPMISLIIDFIKTLSKNKKILDAIKNKKCLSCIK